MKIKKIYALFLFVSITFCLVSTVSAEQLIIPGTGASEVILQELAAAFNAENPGSQVVIPPSVGSEGGIRLVGTGKYVLGRVARNLKESEMKYKLQYSVFAKDMVVFAVGSKVGIKNLSSQQLAEVFSGRILNWKEVGGNDASVKLLVRNQEDSTYAILRQHLDFFKSLEFPYSAKVMFHDYEMVNAFNKYSTVIGWLTNSTLQIVDPSVKPIAIDNVAPTLSIVFDGSYTMAVEYAFVYKGGRLNELAKKFLEFVFSKDGSRILVSKGLVPINGQ